MKKTHSIIISLLVVALSSCSDFLDVKPVGQMIPDEVYQFENILNNTSTLDYFMMDNNRGCFYALMGDNVEVSENQMNHKYNATYPNLDLLAAYIFYQPVLDPKATYSGWSWGMFRPLGLFNNVIDGVSDIDSESEYAKGVIAQAKVGRAWIYLNATLAYGPMYDPNGSNDTKVLPYRSSGDPTQPNGPLLTTAELFDKIKEDLDYACENCPQTVTNPCRANKAAAYALRAEYYMYKRDWPNMLSDSQKAWELALQNKGSVDKLIYDLADFSYFSTTPVEPAEGTSPEHYMNLKGPDADIDQTTNRENLLYRKAPNGNSSSRFYPSSDWQSIFDKKTDLRWKLFALTSPGYEGKEGDVSFDDGNRISYERSDRLSTTSALTYPLLLLMKAEAESRSGKLSEALADLNTIRKFRYSGNNTDLPNGPSLSQEQLTFEILKERRREQPIVSYQRTLDLKRYVFDTGQPWSKTIITHKCGNKTYSKSLKDAFYQSLPIDNVILKYNPSWNIPANNEPYEPYNAK